MLNNLGEVQREGDVLTEEIAENLVESINKTQPEEQKGKENPLASQPEKKLKGQTPSSQGEAEPAEIKASNESGKQNEDPLHEHPRFKEIIKFKNDLLKEVEEIKNENSTLKDKLNKFEGVFNQISANNEALPDWFIELYGDNREAYQKMKNGLYKEIKSEIISDQQKDVQIRQQEEKTKEAERNQWVGWIKNKKQELRDVGEVFDDNKLDKIMIEYRPTDVDGNLDFVAGLKIYKKEYPIEKKDISKQKLIADQTMNGTKSSSDPVKPLTPEQLSKMSFSDLARL